MKQSVRMVLETVFTKCPNTVVLFETADHSVFARVTYSQKARTITCETKHSNAMDVTMMLDAADLLGVRTVDFNVPANQETILVTCPFKIE